MGMEMRLVPALQQKLDTKLEQKLSRELRLEQKMKLALGMSALRYDEEIGGAPEQTIEEVIDYLLEQIPNPDHVEPVKMLLSDPVLRRELIVSATSLANPTKKGVEAFTRSYLFTAHHGTFRIENPEGDSQKDARIVTVPKFIFDSVFVDEAAARREVEVLLGQLRDRKNVDTRGTQQQLDEFQEALFLKPYLDEAMMTISTGLQYALTVKDKAGMAPLAEFLQEYALLGIWDPLVSERLQKRFLASFIRVKEGTAPEQLHNAFLNSVSEYVLMSVGVIDPEIFTLKRTSISDEQANEVRSDCRKHGIDIDALTKKYTLQGRGTIFWNRWHTLHTPPGNITDEKIREFITKTVRRDKEAILDAASYDHFFREIQSASEENGRSTEGRRDFGDWLCAAIADKFQDEKFNKAIKKLIIEKWKPQLDVFYAKK